MLIDPSTGLSLAEKSEAMSFLGRPSQELTADLLQRNFEFIYWLTPEAFVYYLPGIYRASVLESRPDLIVNSSIVEMLARSPNEDLLDNFFLERWSLLSEEECAASQSWLVWLSGCASKTIDEISLSQAFDMLEWLKGRS